METTLNQEIKKCTDMINNKYPEKPLTGLESRALACYYSSLNDMKGGMNK